MVTEPVLRPFRIEDAEHFPAIEALGVDPVKITGLPAWTGLRDGVPVACGGLGFVRPGVAEAWLIISPNCGGCWRWVAKNVKKVVDGGMANGSYRRIQATIPVGRTRWERKYGERRLARWMKFLGMRREGRLVSIAFDGTDEILYARVKRR